MSMVRQTLNDFVSGTVKVVESKVRAFAQRPKREDRKRMGREYTDFLLACLRSEAGKEIYDVIVFKENSPVDLIWLWDHKLSLGVECKRLRKTKFRNDGHAKAWLKREVISRFIDYATETGEFLRTRVLCVSEKKWSTEVDRFLAKQGFYLIETGQIDSVCERIIAREEFLDQFVDILSEVCKAEMVMSDG